MRRGRGSTGRLNLEPLFKFALLQRVRQPVFVTLALNHRQLALQRPSSSTFGFLHFVPVAVQLLYVRGDDFRCGEAFDALPHAPLGLTQSHGSTVVAQAGFAHARATEHQAALVALDHDVPGPGSWPALPTF